MKRKRKKYIELAVEKNKENAVMKTHTASLQTLIDTMKRDKSALLDEYNSLKKQYDQGESMEIQKLQQALAEERKTTTELRFRKNELKTKLKEEAQLGNNRILTHEQTIRDLNEKIQLMTRENEALRIRRPPEKRKKAGDAMNTSETIAIEYSDEIMEIKQSIAEIMKKHDEVLKAIADMNTKMEKKLHKPRSQHPPRNNRPVTEQQNSQFHKHTRPSLKTQLPVQIELDTSMALENQRTNESQIWQYSNPQKISKTHRLIQYERKAPPLSLSHSHQI